MNEPGTTLARYVVIEEIGRGGMGVVVRAYDPKLQREVAIKSLRTDQLSDRAQARLVREAQAMAKLAYPNVVAVHDVETHEGTVLLVMEYVAGTSLDVWLGERARTWEEILAVFVAAGRGLVAAHDAGLLHRDFKPTNVLVGADGRVRVTDFGLARATSSVSTSASEDSDDMVAPAPGVAIELTRPGDVVGTPAYMSPEQHMKVNVGPASDQFAFCVALWEGLTGARPFAGRLKEIAKAKVHGPPPWPKSVPMPPRIVEAIARGLSPRPADRWPSLSELLDVLDARPRRRSKLPLVSAAASAIACGGAIAAVTIATDDAPCEGGEAHLDAAWGEQTRARVEAALGDLEAPFVADVWTRVGAELDAYAQAWIDMHRDACEATAVRGEQSSALLDARMACLHGARIELEAATAMLATADAEVAAGAHELVADLPPLSRCADVEALQSGVEPPPPAHASAIEDVRARLAEARAQRKAGKFARAQAIVDAVRTDAEALPFAPLHTEVALERGLVLAELAEYRDAETELGRALELGLAHRQWALAHEAATSLVMLVGAHEERYGEGLAYAATARGLLPWLSRRAVAEADMRGAAAAVYYAAGRYAEAETERREEIRLVATALGTDHTRIAEARGALANVLAALGRFDEARAAYHDAIAIDERTLGPEHPSTANVRSNFAVVLAELGQFELAERLYREALATKERAFGPRHPTVGHTRGNLGILLFETGRHAEATEQFEAALAIHLEAHGAESPVVLTARANLAGALHAAGRHAEAEAEFRKVLDRRLASTQPLDPAIAMARNNLGAALRALGRLEEAEAEHRAALELRQKVYGEVHPDVADSRNNLAALLTDMGRLGEAEAEHRAALSIRERALGPTHPKVAQSHNNLAIVLQELERPLEAEAHHRTALKLRRDALDDRHPHVASSLHNLAVNLIGQDRSEEAIDLLEQAWAIRSTVEVDALDRAETAYRLAKLIWDRDRSRARSLATEALQTASAAGERGARLTALSRELLGQSEDSSGVE